MKEMDDQELKRMNGKEGNPVCLAFGGRYTTSPRAPRGIRAFTLEDMPPVRISRKRWGNPPMALKCSINSPGWHPERIPSICLY